MKINEIDPSIKIINIHDHLKNDGCDGFASKVYKGHMALHIFSRVSNTNNLTITFAQVQRARRRPKEMDRTHR